MKFLTDLDLSNNEIVHVILDPKAVDPGVGLIPTDTDLIAGRIIYNYNSKRFKYYNGTRWIQPISKWEVKTGSTNGTISFDATDVAVKGLKSAAYQDSSSFATYEQGLKANSAIQHVQIDFGQPAVKQVGDTVTLTLPSETAHLLTNTHVPISFVKDTTVTEDPGYDGTFTIMSDVVRDSYGHVIGIEFKTVTMPSKREWPTALPNPYALLIKNHRGKVTEYNGSESKEVDFSDIWVDAPLTGRPTAPTADREKPYQIVNVECMNEAIAEAIALADAFIYKGTLGTSGDADISELPNTYLTGWTYRIVSEGTWAGEKCEPGDMITAKVDRINGIDTSDDDWNVYQANIDGAITDITADYPIMVRGSGHSRVIGHEASGVVAGQYNLMNVNTTGHITQGQYIDYLTEHPPVDAVFNETNNTKFLEFGNTLKVLENVERDEFGHVLRRDITEYRLPNMPVNTVYKAVAAVPPATAGNPVQITHGMGFTAERIGNFMVYPVIVSVYETATQESVICDIRIIDGNTIELTFGENVSANQYYAVIMG